MGSARQSWRTVSLHSIHALHGADRRFDDGAARVTKRLARAEKRLFTDDTVSGHFLDLAVGVGNDPVTAQQFRGHAAVVGNRNRVGKYVPVRVRLRLLVDVAGRNVNAYFAGNVIHDIILA